MNQLTATLAAIDRANAEDPTDHAGEPLALIQGRLATKWLDELAPQPGPVLRLAVRAHHLRRWELRRADFPEGRAGYLGWRKQNKAHQASSLAALMHDHGWSSHEIAHAERLLHRTRLRNDHETQLLEDAACLVFLETQFDEMAARTDHAHLVSIVAKTLGKMSPQAVTLASSIDLSPTAQVILADAVRLHGVENADDD